MTLLRPRFRTLLLLGALLLGAAGTAASEAPPSAAPVPDLTSLEPAVAERVTEALAAVRQEPSSSRAWGKLAILYEANLLWEEAAQTYGIAARTAAQEAESDPASRGRAGQLRLREAMAVRQTGRFDDALGMLRGLRESNRLPAGYEPSWPERSLVYVRAPLLQRLGEALLEAGQTSEAEAVFEELLALGPAYPTYWPSGDAVRNARDLAAYTGLGAVRLRQGNAEEAAEHLERAVGLSPEYRRARYLLGLALRDLGRREEARQHLAFGSGGGIRYLPDDFTLEVEEAAVNLTARLERAGRLLGWGRTEEAVSLLEQAVADRPSNVSARNNLAAAYLRAGRLDEAGESLARSLALAPDRFSTHLLLAGLADRRRRPEEALAHARRAAELAPDHPTPHYETALRLLRLERLEEALEEARRAVALDPSAALHHALAGDIARRLGRSEEAETYLRRALEIDPSSPPAWLGLAEALLSQGRLDKAGEVLAEAQERLRDVRAAQKPLAALAARLAAARAAADRAQAGDAPGGDS